MKRPIAIIVFALLLGAPFARAADYVATTFADAGDYSVGQGSGLNGDLRYCVVQANANPGSRVYLYNFNYNLSQALPPITTGMTILPTGSFTPNLNANGNGRLLFIDAPGQTVTIQNVRLSNGLAVGGGGGQGGYAGGGGLGAGGGIFVNSGTVSLTSVQFVNCGATGGAGGNVTGDLGNKGGGGGGMGPGGNVAGATAAGGASGGGGGGFRGNGGSGSGNGNGGGGGGGIVGSGGSTSAGGKGGGGGGAIGNGGNAIGSVGGSGGSGGGGAGGAGDANGNGAVGGPGANGAGGGGSGTNPFTSVAVGGLGGTYGGGGGGGNNSYSAGPGGDFGGGGGGNSYGATGGFGGGGGGGTRGAGVGGFGGGGGGTGGNQAAGGLYGGAGAGLASSEGGGGGGALGGAIFVRGGSITLAGCSFSDGTLTAGAGGPSAAGGVTAGPEYFISGGNFGLVVDSDQTIALPIPGHIGQFTKSGAAKLTLTAANFYGGTTYVSAGTLALSGAATLGQPASAPVYDASILVSSTQLWLESGGVLEMGGTNQTIGELESRGSTAVIQNSSTSTSGLTLNGSGFVYGTLNGNLALTKMGTGTLELRNTNTFTGGTTVSGGTLTLTGAGANGLGALVGALTVNTGATVTATAANAFGYATGSKLNTVVLNSATLTTTANNDQGWGVAYTLNNGASMISNGGNANTSGGRFTFGGPGGANTSVFVTGTPASTISGDIDLRADNGNAMCTFTVDTGATLNVPAVITNQMNSAGLTKAGPGLLALSAANPYTGNTVVNGGTLQLAYGDSNGTGTILGGLTVNSGAAVSATAPDALGYLSGVKLSAINLNGGTLLNGAASNQGWGVAYTLNSGAVMDVVSGSDPNHTACWSFGGPSGGNTSVLAIGATASEIRSRVELRGDNGNTAFTFTVNSGATLNVPAVIFSNSAVPPALVKSGAGTLALSGTNTWTGGTNLAAGVLDITNASALGSGSIAFTGGTLRFDGFAADLSPHFTMPAMGQVISIDTSNQFVTLNTPFTGDGGLTKTGSNVLTLNGASTYKGMTTISQGTLRLGDGTNSGSITSDVTDNGTLEFASPGSKTYSGVVSGSGGLVKNGPAGSGLTLTASQSYAGSTLVNTGSLTVASSASLTGSGTVTVASAGELDVNGSINGMVSVSGALVATGGTLNAGATVNQGGTVTAGSGTFTLKGAVLNNGTIRITSGAKFLAGGAGSFVNNGVLDLLTADSGYTLPAGLTYGTNGVLLTRDSLRVKDVSAVFNASHAPTSVAVRVDSYSGHGYTLQRSATPSAADFHALAAVAAQNGTTGTVLTFTDAAPVAGERFYRLVVSP